MKNFKDLFLFMLLSLTGILSSCEVVGDIFEAGVWTGLIIVVLVIAVIIWVIRKIIS